MECPPSPQDVDMLEQYPALAITPGPAVSADTLLRLENIFQQNPKFQVLEISVSNLPMDPGMSQF